MKLSVREIGIILAALRKLEREGYDEQDVFIATDDGQYPLMSIDEIDALCERINS